MALVGRRGNECAIHHSDACNWSITLEVLQRFIHGVAQHLHLKLSAVVTFKTLVLQGSVYRAAAVFAVFAAEKNILLSPHVCVSATSMA